MGASTWTETCGATTKRQPAGIGARDGPAAEVDRRAVAGQGNAQGLEVFAGGSVVVVSGQVTLRRACRRPPAGLLGAGPPSIGFPHTPAGPWVAQATPDRRSRGHPCLSQPALHAGGPSGCKRFPRGYPVERQTPAPGCSILSTDTYNGSWAVSIPCRSGTRAVLAAVSTSPGGNAGVQPHRAERRVRFKTTASEVAAGARGPLGPEQLRKRCFRATAGPVWTDPVAGTRTLRNVRDRGTNRPARNADGRLVACGPDWGYYGAGPAQLALAICWRRERNERLPTGSTRHSRTAASRGSVTDTGRSTCATCADGLNRPRTRTSCSWRRRGRMAHPTASRTLGGRAASRCSPGRLLPFNPVMRLALKRMRQDAIGAGNLERQS